MTLAVALVPIVFVVDIKAVSIKVLVDGTKFSKVKISLINTGCSGLTVRVTIEIYLRVDELILVGSSVSVTRKK